MKVVRFFKTRYLEILVIGIILAKLGLATFPLLKGKASSINIVKDTLSVNDAIAKEAKTDSPAAGKTVLASNDSSDVKTVISHDTKESVTEESNMDLLASTNEGLDLEKVKEDLMKREALLKEREKKLEALRATVEKEINQLITIQNEIRAHLEKKVAEREAKSKYLAKMYSSMKAKKAAKLLVELDEDLAVKVLKLMKPETAGQILTYLDPKKAAGLTREFYYK